MAEEWNDERVKAAVLKLHGAAQDLADAMADHLKVEIESPSLSARLGRIYHPPSCDKHGEWERDPNNRVVAEDEKPSTPVDIPDGFKSLFQ